MSNSIFEQRRLVVGDSCLFGEGIERLDGEGDGGTFPEESDEDKPERLR